MHITKRLLLVFVSSILIFGFINADHGPKIAPETPRGGDEAANSYINNAEITNGTNFQVIINFTTTGDGARVSDGVFLLNGTVVLPGIQNFTNGSGTTIFSSSVAANKTIGEFDFNQKSINFTLVKANLTDGPWELHAQIVNATSASPISGSLEFIVDTSVPTFTASTTNRTSTTITFNQNVTGSFDATKWTVAGSTAESISPSGSQTNVTSAVLTHTTIGVDETPIVTYTAGDLADKALNVVASASVTASDGNPSRGGGTASDRSPPSFSTGFTENEYPIIINNKQYTAQDLASINTTKIQTGQPIEFTIKLYENQGPQSVQHVALYLNHQGNIIKGDGTETAIIWDSVTRTSYQIQDPLQLISNAKVTPSQEGNKAVFTFEVIFANEIPESDVLFYFWDSRRNDLRLLLPDALIVEKATGIIQPSESVQDNTVSEDTEQKTIEDNPSITNSWNDENKQVLKKWGGYAAESAPDGEVMDMVGVKGTQIPKWVKGNVNWFIDEQVTFQEFVNMMKYLEKKGYL